jgi:hypothetical protein
MNLRRPFQIVAALLATQFILGCGSDEAEDSTPKVPVVNVPTKLERPKQLVSNWKGLVGEKSMDLGENGVCKSKSKVQVNATNANRTMDVNVDCEWGTEGTKFYLYNFKTTPALVFDWTLEGDTLILKQGKYAQKYSRIKP